MTCLGRVARLGACIAVLALSGGCSSKLMTPEDSEMDQASADDFAVQAIAALAVVSDDLQGAARSTPPEAPMSAHVRPARAMWDTTFTGANGLSYSASRTLYDAADVEQPSWNPQVRRVNWTSTASGTAAGPQDTATVSHEAVLDLRGVEAGQDTLRFDGGCIDTLFIRFRSLDGTRTRYFLWTSVVDIASVRFLKSTVQTGRPISGRVTFAILADRLRSYVRTDVETRIETSVAFVFNDDGTADMTVNRTFSYRWNLQTGVITRA